MPQSRPGPEASAGQEQPQEANVLRQLLRSPGYLKLLCLSALLGIPVSLAAFWFLVLIRRMETSLWTDLPKSLGWDVPPWWWPLPLLLVGGIVVGWSSRTCAAPAATSPRAACRPGVPPPPRSPE